MSHVEKGHAGLYKAPKWKREKIGEEETGLRLSLLILNVEEGK